MSSFTIIVRYIDSNKGQNIKDLEIPTDGTLSYQKLKQSIRQSNPYCSNKRLKLIYNGRVLNEYFNFTNDLTINAETGKVYIHCVIGEELTRDQLSKENQLDNREITRSTNPEIIGFDRLLQQGFTQEDINDLRSQFEQIYNLDQPSAQINDLEEEERRQNYIRQLEERWIELTIGGNNNPNGTSGSSINIDNPTRPGDGNNNVDTNAEETMTHPVPQAELEDNHNEDLLIGLLVGVFLGVIGLIFITADDTVFNKRQKMAIIAGLFINFSIAIVRGQWI